MLKSLFSFAFILIFAISCEDLKRDNLLDPKNEDGYRKSVVLMEAFVNTNNPYEYNEWSLNAAEKVRDENRADVVLCEYHRNITLPDTTYIDEYSNPEFDDLHKIYAEYSETGSRSVPDVYLNGAENRINGASSQESVYNRIMEKLPVLISVKNFFTIDNVIVNKKSAGKYDISFSIAPLGNRSVTGLRVKAVFIKDYTDDNLSGYTYAAVGFNDKTEIDKIDAGTFYNGSVKDILVIDQPDALIVSVTSLDKTETYQSVLQEIE